MREVDTVHLEIAEAAPPPVDTARAARRPEIAIGAGRRFLVDPTPGSGWIVYVRDAATSASAARPAPSSTGWSTQPAVPPP
jgi:hypothetical protein